MGKNVLPPSQDDSKGERTLGMIGQVSGVSRGLSGSPAGTCGEGDEMRVVYLRRDVMWIPR